MEDKVAPVGLRAGWRLRWSSTEARMRTREEATRLRAGLGEWAECRGGVLLSSCVKQAGLWATQGWLGTFGSREGGGCVGTP